MTSLYREISGYISISTDIPSFFCPQIKIFTCNGKLIMEIITINHIIFLHINQFYIKIRQINSLWNGIIFAGEFP